MNALKDLLNAKVKQYNHPSFLAEDPIGIPRRFTNQQDKEIAGFFAAILAWGNRKSIITSCNKLMAAMNNEPYRFIMENDWHQNPAAFNVFNGFVHRTFNDLDLWHLLNFLQHHYLVKGEQSLETAFTQWMHPDDETIEQALTGFHHYVFNFSEDATLETHCRKHIASPLKKSACKRLNMYLRWMVRKDAAGVDFGIWKNIRPAQLVIPIDVHVSRVAKRLGILHRTQNDWQAAMELTGFLRELDAEDPIKYDFALFGIGVMEKY